jgi:IPT/TIG domain-containing protein
MTVIDDRGRVFGRINLIDAAAALFIFVLVPIAYGAYLLFRTPPAKLTAITPDKLYGGPNQRVRISGVNLRPFMRVSFGGTQGVTFAIVSTTSAEVEVPELPPGTYDVELFDYRQLVDRLPKGLTVLNLAPVSSIDMEVTGSFKGMNAASAKQFKAGQTLARNGQHAEVLRVGAPVPEAYRITAGSSVLTLAVPNELEVPAALRINCHTEGAPDGSVRCIVQGPLRESVVAPDSLLTLPGIDGWVTFQVATVALPGETAMLTVHAVADARPEIAALVKAGDLDANAVAYATRASVAAVVSVRPMSPTDSVIDLTLRVPAVQGPAGWVYNTQVIKAGLPIRFESANYVLQGTVLKVDAPPERRP